MPQPTCSALGLEMRTVWPVVARGSSRALEAFLGEALVSLSLGSEGAAGRGGSGMREGWRGPGDWFTGQHPWEAPQGKGEASGPGDQKWLLRLGL